jgi:hypothetical protein
MYGSAIPMEIEGWLNNFLVCKDKGDIDMAIYWLDQSCRGFRKLHDWYHVEKYAKEGVILSHNNSRFANEASFLIDLTFFAVSKKDKLLLISFTKDYIYALSKALSNLVEKEKADQKAQGYEYEETREIKFYIEKIERQKRYLEEIKEETFVWPEI